MFATSAAAARTIPTHPAAVAIGSTIVLGSQVLAETLVIIAMRSHTSPLWRRQVTRCFCLTAPRCAEGRKPRPSRQRVEDFDLVHSHIDWLHLPLLSRLNVVRFCGSRFVAEDRAGILRARETPAGKASRQYHKSSAVGFALTKAQPGLIGNIFRFYGTEILARKTR
jgi:hypothetical protein